MPDRARCKFRCDAVTHYQTNLEVTLSAEYDKTLPEDQRFCETTPGGSMKFIINNPNLDGFFLPGKRYYIDLTPCE
jgi:hypothetical protein